MFLFPQTALLAVSEQATTTVAWISFATVLVLFAVIALLCIQNNRRYNAKKVAFAGISLSVSFALSFVKFSPVASGGSITVASMLPLLLYSYCYGFKDGLLVGVAFGLLNFLSGPWILTPATFFLDYPLAYASIALMALPKKWSNRPSMQVLLGVLLVYAVRFTFHFFSGALYFLENAIWVEFPAWAVSGPFVYSFIYQCLYLPADALICLLLLLALSKTKTIERLQGFMKS